MSGATHTTQVAAWRRWLIPQPFTWVSSVLCLGVVGVFLYNQHLTMCVPQWGRIWGVLGCASALLVLERIEGVCCGPVLSLRMTGVALLVRIGLTEWLALFEDYHFAAFLYVLLPFMVWRDLGRAAGLGIAVLVWARYVAHLWVMDRTWYLRPFVINELLTFSMGLVFMIVMAHVVTREQTSRQRSDRLLDELRDSHAQLRRYAAQVSELATTEERNRLARDIHDGLGHALTAINIQLEQALVFREIRPDAGVLAINRAKHLASAALTDVRRSVGTLRRSVPFSLMQSAAVLVDTVRQTGLAVDYTITGPLPSLAHLTQMALYRAMQEGLTNIQRHAHADRVRVHLILGAAPQLLIEDNGIGFSCDRLAEGNGFAGMRERLAFVGGAVTISSTPGQGTALRISVPTAWTDPLAASVAFGGAP